MADPARAAKLAQRIKVVVAEALGRRVKDPRVEAITVTDARVTNDLQHATVYYTVFGDGVAQTDAAKALEKAKGVLRQEVGRNITVRLTPTLEFVADQIPVNASNLEELLRVAKQRDAEVAALAANAQPAGEADPYKSDSPNTGIEGSEIDEDDFDEEDLDLGGDGDIEEDSNK
jgi:ribosome-binding factor A